MNENASGCCRSGLILPTLILSGTMLMLGLTGFFIARELRQEASSIRIKGFAEKHITSDHAVWNAVIADRSPQVSTASVKLETDRQKLVKFLVDAGITQDEITVFSPVVTPVYKTTEKGGDNGPLDHFDLSLPIKVESKNVNLVDKVSRDVGNLLKDGVEIQSQPPAFFYSKIEDLKIEMLGAAAADARKRAESIAEKSHASVGKLRSAQQGVFQITPVFSQEVNSDGFYDTTSIEKTIHAIVTVSYDIK